MTTTSSSESWQDVLFEYLKPNMGRGRLMLVEGKVCIGKTYLLNAMKRRLPPNVTSKYFSFCTSGFVKLHEWLDDRKSQTSEERNRTPMVLFVDDIPFKGDVDPLPIMCDNLPDLNVTLVLSSQHGLLEYYKEDAAYPECAASIICKADPSNRGSFHVRSLLPPETSYHLPTEFYLSKETINNDLPIHLLSSNNNSQQQEQQSNEQEPQDEELETAWEESHKEEQQTTKQEGEELETAWEESRKEECECECEDEIEDEEEETQSTLFIDEMEQKKNDEEEPKQESSNQVMAVHDHFVTTSVAMQRIARLGFRCQL